MTHHRGLGDLRHIQHAHDRAVALLGALGLDDAGDLRWGHLITEDGLTTAEAFTGSQADCAWCLVALGAEEQRRTLRSPVVVPAQQFHENCVTEFIGALSRGA
jgi:hypothetical protein